MPDPNFARVTSYEEISPFVGQYYNYPAFTLSFTRKDFASEFDQAHDILIRHLSEVGAVAEGTGDGDFSLYRYVDLNRAITVVLDGEAAFGSATIPAVLSALEEFSADYVICFDAHPVYCCVFKGGRVLGYEPEPGKGILARLGFPS